MHTFNVKEQYEYSQRGEQTRLALLKGQKVASEARSTEDQRLLPVKMTGNNMQNPLNRDRALYIGTCFLWALIRNRGRGEIILEFYCRNLVGRYCICYTCVPENKTAAPTKSQENEMFLPVICFSKCGNYFYNIQLTILQKAPVPL